MDLKTQKLKIEEQIAFEPVTEWCEDFKPDGSVITFNADAFDQWSRSLLPEHLRDLPIGEKKPVGDLLFRFREFPLIHSQVSFSFFIPSFGVQRSSLSMGPRRGRCRFNKPVGIPQLIKKNDDVWMSLTPMEVLTQRPGVKKAKGKVLIGGLGMGWFTRKVCEKKSVESVTVYEINPAVASEFKFSHPKLNVVVGDAYQADHSKFDSLLFDIWEYYGDAKDNRKFCELKNSHPQVWGWGDVN